MCCNTKTCVVCNNNYCNDCDVTGYFCEKCEMNVCELCNNSRQCIYCNKELCKTCNELCICEEEYMKSFMKNCCGDCNNIFGMEQSLYNVKFCKNCDDSYCIDCRDFFQCDKCKNDYCNNCEENVTYCDSCFTFNCVECVPTIECSVCEYNECGKCYESENKIKFCNFCQKYFCIDCMTFSKCSDCDDLYCNRCIKSCFCNKIHCLKFNCFKKTNFCEECDILICEENCKKNCKVCCRVLCNNCKKEVSCNDYCIKCKSLLVIVKENILHEKLPNELLFCILNWIIY